MPKDLVSTAAHYDALIDKGREEFLDFGTRRVRLYPDEPEDVCRAIAAAGLVLTKTLDTRRALLLVAAREK